MNDSYDKNIVIIGLGNPLLTDDAIGLLIVQEFELYVKDTQYRK